VPPAARTFVCSCRSATTSHLLWTSPQVPRKGLKQRLPKRLGWLVGGRGRGEDATKDEGDSGGLKKDMIGAPTDFKVVGHIGDREGRLKGFGVGLQPGMLLGDEVVGLVGLLRPKRHPKRHHGHAPAHFPKNHHKHHHGHALNVHQGYTYKRMLSQTSACKDEMLGGREYADVHYMEASAAEVVLDPAPEVDASDRIGVQDQTYRHSWPSAGVVYSRVPGGRVEQDADEDDHASSVFQLKDLQMGRVLGEGFFGRVYEASNTKTGQQVVIKELKETGHEAQVAFIHEVAILKHISHPNLLHYLGLYVRDDVLNMVTEFVGGGTLEDVILGVKEQFKTLSWQDRVSMAYDISEGMAYMHSRRIIHRDLKPENCLVRSATNLSIVIVDFGLARIMEGEVLRDADESGNASSNAHGPSSGTRGLQSAVKARAKSTRNMTHDVEVSSKARRMSVVGTVDYMAPEVAMHQEYNESCDVFSFGLILACGLIARRNAEADEFRGADFALNAKKFRSAHAHGVPPKLIDLACECGVAAGADRPAFAQIMARLRLIELGLPVDLARIAAAGDSEPMDEVEDTPEEDALPVKHRDFIFVLLAEVGVDAKTATRAQILDAATKAGLKKTVLAPKRRCVQSAR